MHLSVRVAGRQDEVERRGQWDREMARTTQSSRTTLSMERPVYASIEEMLATKEGQCGSLSIVARRSPAGASLAGASLAAVGLAPSGGAGQAAIVYEFEGHVRAIFTTAESPFRIGRADRVPGEGELVVRTRQLDAAHVDEFHLAMEDLAAREDLGLRMWTPIRTSAAFAADLWNRTFGEQLEHRAFGLSNADNLAKSIRSLSAREMGTEQSPHEPLDLRITDRILELTQQKDLQDQCQDGGLEL